MQNPFDLSGKRVLITGAAGGIGTATARSCAKIGADLILTDIKPCDALLEELAGRGTKATFIQCDVRDRDAIDKLANEAGDVDVLILNAGAIAYNDWNDPDWEETFHQIIGVNLLAPMHFSRAFLPAMKARGSGRIVLVGSIAGWTGGTLSTTGSHYVASKGGIHAFTRWLARRAAPEVIVNAVAPSATLTPMIADQPPPAGSTPLGRLASADEIAWPITFLSTNAASFVCGAILDVNGGAFLR